MGHSNGCDVIADALAMAGQPPIRSIHLISAACKADFTRNGYNEVNTKYISIYIAEKDGALKLAGTKLGRLFGYGVLGKTGPKKVRSGLLTTITHRPFGHSDWFAGEHFKETMRMIGL